MAEWMALVYVDGGWLGVMGEKNMVTVDWDRSRWIWQCGRSKQVVGLRTVVRGVGRAAMGGETGGLVLPHVSVQRSPFLVGEGLGRRRRGFLRVFAGSMEVTDMWR